MCACLFSVSFEVTIVGFISQEHYSLASYQQTSSSNFFKKSPTTIWEFSKCTWQPFCRGCQEAPLGGTIAGFSVLSDSGAQFWPVSLAVLLTEIALLAFSFLKELVKMWWQNKSYHCDSRLVISESIPGHSFRTIPQHYLEVDWLLVKDITNQFVHSWDDNAISLKYNWAPFTFSVHSKKKTHNNTVEPSEMNTSWSNKSVKGKMVSGHQGYAFKDLNFLNA